MKTRILFILILFGLLCFGRQDATAQTVLTSDAAKSFIDFYFYGQGQGVVLADLKICTQVVENECLEEVSPIALELGVSYMVWMMYVVPEGVEEEKVTIQYNNGGITKKSGEVTVKGSIRYRTWKTFRPNQAGNWEIVVLYDNEGDTRKLKTVTATVNE